MVHDEVKDKMFELELSWVGEFTNGIHMKVPDSVIMIIFFDLSNRYQLFVFPRDQYGLEFKYYI